MTHLQKLALDAAQKLKDDPAVDGVFVMVLSKRANDFGSAMLAPAVEINVMFATGIDALVQIRKQSIANAVPMPEGDA